MPVLYAEGNWHFEAENLVPNQILVVGEVWWNVGMWRFQMIGVALVGATLLKGGAT